MPGASNVIGIDVGSVSVSAAELDLKGNVVRTAYEIHRGRIEATLRRILSRFDLSGTCGIAATSCSPAIIRATGRCDIRIALISAVHRFYRSFGSILIVGGEKFGLLRFDEQGNYLSFKANTSCAAGTGSFLDQQAQRLNLSGIGELSEIAFENSGPVPKIASRCAVFVKTDLVHAQQEGYSLAEICDGLCHGLARSIFDTLFAGERPLGPLVFTGGVSLNRAVVKHLQSMTGEKMLIHAHSHLFGAIGAALHLIGERRVDAFPKLESADDILIRETRPRKYFYGPLQLKLSDYPDFEGVEKYEFRSETAEFLGRVEVDLYENLMPGATLPAYLGIDIGSTSTKAVLLSPDRAVLSGFYTRTAGRPLQALQSILAAIDDLLSRKGLDLSIVGTGATGAGRKFIGRLIGADLVVDEITAHARAAYQLNPEVDTIIEIGGQDSKFTTVKNGSVTSAIMNTACAAGTGSFIEEQGHKLGCPLTDFSERTERRCSPIASDRCTVFMERDINHYLSEGYSVDEVLAAVLHAVRENYLAKVAVEGRIGKTVSFQGATAKNRALVAAFEQRLGKPIHVSKYCHLTGALGAALIVADEGLAKTGFRGIGLHRKTIPLRSEVCGFCANHCKITVADIDGEKVSYGFLCGRDYQTKKHVDGNGFGFDLIRERKKAFAWKPKKETSQPFVIGIPAALHLFEDMSFWRHFFDTLGIETITSEDFRDAVAEGKHAAGVEFCAPMAALYGHVNHLKEKCDFVFVPFYLEKKSGKAEGRRQYCYYTQYAAPLASGLFDESSRSRCLTPLVHYLYSPFHIKAQLYRMLKPICTRPIGFAAVSAAYDRAGAFRRKALRILKERFMSASGQTSDRKGEIDVVLLGRPYTVLSRSMNKGIPDLFASLGVKTFFQDMLSYGQKEIRSVSPLLSGLHWNYAAKILASAAAAARTEGVYPVLVTSFKCSPDSFVMEYFRKLMEAHDKPYLILQLDEHDSRVGYETRIEAAVRSFRNHRLHSASRPQQIPTPQRATGVRLGGSKAASLSGKTLFFPAWDDLSLRLIVAALEREGIDARLLEGNETTIQKSLRSNTGQCIPLNIIAQEFIDCIEKNDLDPSKTVLWLGASEIACNIHLYPAQIRNLLDSYGKGMEKAGIYAGSMSMREISIRMTATAYFAYMFGGYLRRMACKLRPYEKVRGCTDAVVEKSLAILEEAFRGRRSREDALAQVCARFDAVETTPHKRPKAAIFGDLYVRDNPRINQDLIYFIEENGGEVITTPYSEYSKMIARTYLRKWWVEGYYWDALTSKALIAGLKLQERTYYRYFNRILDELEPAYDDPPAKILSEYGIRIENTGESMDNILKIHYIQKHHPDVALFVQTSPAFCCPALVTEAMARKIEQKTGVPIVSITYDGTGGSKNDALIPYLRYPRTDFPVRRGTGLNLNCLTSHTR